MATPFKLRSGNGPLKFKNMGSSPVKKEEDKTDPETVDVDPGTGTVHGTGENARVILDKPITYENPYLAYQMKNIPKKSTVGAPLAGGKIFSNVSGLQVSGPGVEDSTNLEGKTGRERTDELMRGEGNVYMMEGEGLSTVDKDKSGLPDELETGMSEEVRNLGKDKKKVKKELTKAEKIKAYQKSQLSL
jgi:hypothetical protein